MLSESQAPEQRWTVSCKASDSPFPSRQAVSARTNKLYQQFRTAKWMLAQQQSCQQHLFVWRCTVVSSSVEIAHMRQRSAWKQRPRSQNCSKHMLDESWWPSSGSSGEDDTGGCSHCQQSHCRSVDQLVEVAAEDELDPSQRPRCCVPLCPRWVVPDQPDLPSQSVSTVSRAAPVPQSSRRTPQTALTPRPPRAHRSDEFRQTFATFCQSRILSSGFHNHTMHARWSL